MLLLGMIIPIAAYTPPEPAPEWLKTALSEQQDGYKDIFWSNYGGDAGKDWFVLGCGILGTMTLIQIGFIIKKGG
jgi:hypothetical protein